MKDGNMRFRLPCGIGAALCMISGETDPAIPVRQMTVEWVIAFGPGQTLTKQLTKGVKIAGIIISTTWTLTLGCFIYTTTRTIPISTAAAFP
jgi:hypothetical protein